MTSGYRFVLTVRATLASKKLPLAVAAAFSSLACNAVFGLDELRFAGSTVDGGADAQANDAGPDRANDDSGDQTSDGASDEAAIGEWTPNATRCAAGAANSVETCDGTGHWSNATACTFVCDTVTKNCGGECVPGTADRCSGSTVQSCDATGRWKDKTPCGTTPCTMGQCRACTSNEKQCNAGKPQTCNASGTWVDDQAT